VFPSTGLTEPSSVTSVKEPAWDLPGSEDAQTLDPLQVQNKHTQNTPIQACYLLVYDSHFTYLCINVTNRSMSFLYSVFMHFIQFSE
jgi:hypothetical protein